MIRVTAECKGCQKPQQELATANRSRVSWGVCRNTLFPTGYHAQLGRSKSNVVGV